MKIQLVLVSITTYITILQALNFNSFVLQATSLILTSDMQYGSAIINNTIYLYKQAKGQYQVIDHFKPPCNYIFCTISFHLMSDDGSKIITYSSNDSYYRFHTVINNSAINYIQGIKFLNPNYQDKIPPKNQYFLMGNTSYFAFYVFNSTITQYELNYSSAATTYIYDFTSDGRYIANMASNYVLKLHTFTNGTYSLSSMALPNISDPGSGSDIAFIHQNGTIKFFILIKIGTVFTIHYYKIINSTVTFIQLIDNRNQFWLLYLYLTQTSNYLTVSTLIPLTYLYRYDSNIDRYVSLHNFTDSNGYFFYQAVVFENLMVVYGNIRRNYAYQDHLIYYQCRVPNCKECSWLNTCEICENNFTLTSELTCGCNSLQTLVGSSCVSCNIQHCSSCSVCDVCDSCQDGYELKNNVCICPSGKTVSDVNFHCVSCRVDSCYRCDYENDCALFLQNSQTATTVLAAIVLAVCLAILIVLLLIVKKITSLSSSAQVHNEGPQLQRRDSFKTTNVSFKLQEVGSDSLTKIKEDIVEESQIKVKRTRKRKPKTLGVQSNEPPLQCLPDLQ